MNSTWNFLREFESKDLIKRFYKKKHGLELNSTKAFEISSAFIQGREYFSSYSKADISVQPLLLYYGIVSLSRGLILFLNHRAKENNIAPAHGLSLKNVPDIISSRKYQDLEIGTTRGTFRELIAATKNKSYIRNGSSAINTYLTYDIPENDFSFTLLDLAYNLPDLKKTAESWLNETIPTAILKNWIKQEDEKYIITLTGKYEPEFCNRIFPAELFPELTTEIKNNETIISHSKENLPQIAQMWISCFQTVGAPFVTPPLGVGIFLNNISIMFAASYVFGMISRYYPSTWNNINKGIMNDSIFPFAINLMSFLETKYPQIILDYLMAPHDFEKK
jgi:hypothetical protein